MRSRSPLSLLLFLQLTTAFPVFTRITPPSKECLHPSSSSSPSSCTTLRDVINELSLTHSRPSDPRNPHFPEHQKLPLPEFVKPTNTYSDNEHFAEEGAFNNAPTTPSKDVTADEALSAQAPLSSAYLQSLTRTSGEGDAMPSMPTSALPSLRKEDAKKYWEGEVAGKGMNRVKGCGNSGAWSGAAVGHRSRLTHLEMGRRSDFMVVGIVVVFLVVVCALELLDGKRSLRRGEIFLEDDETYAFVVKKPREFFESESACYEKRVQKTGFKEYRDDETIVDESGNGDS